MTMNIDAGSSLPLSGAVSRAQRSWLPWLAVAAVLVAAIALRNVVAANTDVSWLLIAGERVLDGQHLYADILETNPPMAVLVYLPGIAIARTVGVRPELVTDGILLVLAMVSLWAASIILSRSAKLDEARQWPQAAFAAAVLTILPMHIFGQREHIALICFLPALAGYVRRAGGGSLPLWTMLVAGIGAGMTLTFKPHFVFAPAFCIAAAAIRSRSWRPLFAPENFIAAAIVVIYGVLTSIFFPEYFTMILPLVRDVYVPLTMPFSALVGSTATTLWAIVAFSVFVLAHRLRDQERLQTGVLVAFAASLGFAVAFFLQGKGWAYQSYPMLAVGMITLGYAIAAFHGVTQADRRISLAGLLLLATVFASGSLWFNATFNVREIDEPVARLKPHPKILMLSGEAVIGHPLVRTLQGVWVSRQQGLWVREFVRRLRQNGPIDPQTDARLDGYLMRERQGVIEDFIKQPPDVILIDNLSSDWGAWARSDPELTNLLKPYVLSQTIRGIDILYRKADASAS